MNLFSTKYRVARDRYFPSYWAVQAKVWCWPCWFEFGNGLLKTKDEALDLIKELRTIR